jgi:hypothetical protein
MKMAFLLIVIIVAFAAAAIAADPVGEIVAIEGKVSGTDVNGDVRILELRSSIFLNDTIVTEANSKVQVMFDDATVVSQGENSELIIDEYVYSPDKKDKDNCSLKLLKGVFRVVTGKITELNPERFKVRTRMATIGIRGCGLLLKLRNEKEEDILITEVSAGRSIAIWQVGLDQEIPDGAEWMDGPDVLSVLEAGVAVIVREGAELTQRPFAPDEVGNAVLEATPIGGVDDGGADDGGGASDGGDSVGSSDSDDDMVDTINDLLATKKEDDALAALEEGVGGTGGGGDGRTDIFAKPDDPTDLPPKPNGPGTTPGTGAALMNPPPFPGVGTDWSWGVWDDASMSFDGNYLTAADFDTIMTGANTYNLSGSGQSGASLEHNGRLWFVEGSCDLDVTVGNGSTPVWDGTFSLARDGNSLDFTAAGTITSGTLSGNYNSYSMQVDRQTFDNTTISSHSIGGRLVGPGVAPTPITGAVGDYSFDHNNGETKVRGVYGVDLSATAP